MTIRKQMSICLGKRAKGLSLFFRTSKQLTGGIPRKRNTARKSKILGAASLGCRPERLAALRKIVFLAEEVHPYQADEHHGSRAFDDLKRRNASEPSSDDHAAGERRRKTTEIARNSGKIAQTVN